MTPKEKSAEPLCRWCGELIVSVEMAGGDYWYICSSCESQHALVKYTDSESGREVNKFVPLSPIPPTGEPMTRSAASRGRGKAPRKRRSRWVRWLRRSA